MFQTNRNFTFTTNNNAFDNSGVSYTFTDVNKSTTNQKSFLIRGSTNTFKSGSYFEVQKSGSVPILYLAGDAQSGSFSPNELYISGSLRVNSGNSVITGSLIVSGSGLNTVIVGNPSGPRVELSPLNQSYNFRVGNGNWGFFITGSSGGTGISGGAFGLDLRSNLNIENNVSFITRNSTFRHQLFASTWNITDFITGAQRLSINQGGNVLIGTGSISTGVLLDVRAQGALSTDIAFRIRNSANTTNLVEVRGNGNVGIGTTSDAGFRLDISGSTRIQGNTIITGSFTVVTGSAVELQVTNTGVNIGNIITDTHTVTGSLNISGSITTPVILNGTSFSPSLNTTTNITQTNSGSFTVYSFPTASYDTAFFEYSVKSGSNARAGTIMAIQSGTSVNFTETTTTDFGNTTPVSFTVVVTGSNMALTGSSTTGSWTIKTIIRTI
jgi:hypothetical protein